MIKNLRYLCTLLLVMVASVTWADEVTFEPGDFKATTANDYSLTKSGVTVSVTASTVTDSQMRIFKGKTLTVTAPEGASLTKIVITCTANGTAQYGPGNFTTESGYSHDNGKEGTWEGEADEVVLTATGAQVRATKIVVTYVTADQPGEKKNARLAFAETEFTVLPDADFEAPELTKAEGFDGTVVYSSSDENLALVDETTGEVIIGSEEGTVTITATSAETENFKAGEASYTITIAKGEADLSFEKTAFTVEPDADFEAPELVNPHGLTVTYSSSDEEIAVVDETTGEVLVGSEEGTATITATFAGNAQYKAGEASYTITIKEAASQPDANGYVKVTSTADLTDGIYLIVYEEGNVAFNGGLKNLDAVSNTVAVTISDGVIAQSDDMDAASFTIDVTAGTILSASGYYIGQASDANGLTSSQTENYTNTITIADDGTATITGSGKAVLRYNATSGQTRFRYYKSTSYTNQKAIALYKKVESAEEAAKEDAEFSFGETTSFTVNTGESFTEPTLNYADGFNGTIVYSISGDDIATINAENGKLTLNGNAGQALITASAEATDKFKAGKATYTLTVVKVYNGIAELIAAGAGTAMLKLDNALVTLVNGNDMFIQDATAGIDIYKLGLDFEEGDLVSGTAKVTWVLYKGMPEITAVDGSFEKTGTQEVVPTVIDIEDITNYNCMLVTVEDVEIENNYIGSVQVYGKFMGGNSVKYDNGIATVTGVVMPYDTKWEICPRTAEDVSYLNEVTVGELGLATYYNSKALTVPAGVKAETYTVEEGVLTVSKTYEAGDVLPNATAVVLTAEAGTYKFYTTTREGVLPESTMLQGSSSEITVDDEGYKYYILSDGTNGVGFYYQVEGGTSVTTAANKAYLAVPEEDAAGAKFFTFGGTTAIEAIEAAEKAEVVYNLAGQRVEKAQKGVFIVNGKKVVF